MGNKYNIAYYSSNGINLELREENNQLIYCGLTETIKTTRTPNGILKQAFDQLDQYFYGNRTQFSIPLKLNGTEFQKSVWVATSKITFGKTSSYKDIAKSINKEKSSRAVGNSLGANKIIIFIPCHRIISSNGSIGGFTGGIEIKKKLLEIEKIIFFPTDNV